MNRLKNLEIVDFSLPTGETDLNETGTPGKNKENENIDF